MRALFLICTSVAQINMSSAFLSPINAGRIQSSHFFDHHSRCRTISTSRHASADDSSNEESEDPKEGGTGFSALPPIGASSFWDRPRDENAYANDAYESSDLARPGDKNTNKNGIIISEHTNLVSPKFQIQYTCKVCSTRNSHSVSRIAYRNGVVIAFCKGKSCEAKHLLADNLGWSNYVGGFDNGETNIETYMANKALEARENGVVDGKEENDLVKRVNQDVFDLETILYKGKEGKKNMLSAKGSEKGGDQVEDGDETSWS